MSMAPIQPTGGGQYVMGNATYDIGTLLMTIGLERANLIEQQIIDQANEMKKRNQTIEALAKAMAALRAGEDDGKLFDANTFDTGILNPDAKPPRNYSLKELMEKNGMGMLEWDKKQGSSDWYWGKEEKKEAIEVIKAKIDSLNSDSQMDQIRLQGLMTKRDQTFEMVTNIMSKDAKSKDAIIGNLR